MTATNLRALAKDYANGVIDREQYRSARAKLIEGILAGRVKVEDREFIAPVEAGDDTDITQEKTALHTEPDAFRSTGEFKAPPAASTPVRRRQVNSSHKWIIGSAIVIIICSAVIVSLLFQEDETVTPVANEVVSPPPVEPARPAEEPVTVTSGAGITLVEEFLARNNWQEKSIEQFLAEWRELSREEQQAALSSPLLTELNNAIYRQLLQEQALIGLADPEKIMSRQETLVNLARSVGIYDDRLTVQAVKILPVTSGKSPVQEETVTEDVAPQEAAATTGPDSEEAAPETTPTVPVEQAEQADKPQPDTSDVTSFTAESAGDDITADTPQAATDTPAVAATEADAGGDEAVTAASDSAAAETTAAGTGKTATSDCRASLARQRRPYCRDSIPGTGKAPTMVVLPAGKFIMGGEKPEEQPRHEVIIDRPFAISVNEITQGEFELFCADTGRSCPPQPWSGKDYPVVNVSWHDAVDYTQWQSEKTGNTYRLPTEAEWEYAARGQTRTPYPFGEEVLITDAVFSDVKQLTSPLPKNDRSVNRNKFRLYHMVGNVREWVLDPWHDDYGNAPADGSVYEGPSTTQRVVRGGSYADPAEALRSAARIPLKAGTSDDKTGFRILQELE